MTRSQLRRRAKEIIDVLPPKQLRAALRYFDHLRYGTNDPATLELLRIPGLVESIRAAERDVAAGRATPVDRLRRKF